MSRGRRPGEGQLSLLGQCLQDRDRAVLDFAARHHFDGGVTARVQVELGCDEWRYVRELSALLDRPEAAEAHPVLVTKLRALRDRRRRLRTPGR